MPNDISTFFDLNRGNDGDREKPHKPVTLLVLLDLIQSGTVTDNRVLITQTFINLWKKYFAIVKEGNDRPNLHLPLFYLKSDGFWHIYYKPGISEQAFSSLNQVRKQVEHFSLDLALWTSLQAMTKAQMDHLRFALITRYFGGHAVTLIRISDDFQNLPRVDADREAFLEEQVESNPHRSSQFAKLVVKAYQNQCAMCGFRLVTGTGVTMVDAAHLIPFAESHDDHPGNGMALCKNHHWVMDRQLVAPGPNHVWHISPLLDERQSGQRELMSFQDKPVLLPQERAFYPKKEALEYRLENLAG